MAEVLQHKVVSALPSPLQANSIYYVRVGTGFDEYVTNSSGTIVAYGLNAPAYTGIGVEQSWQAMTRALGVTYTNTTGKPIQLYVTLRVPSGGSGYFNFEIGGEVLEHYVFSSTLSVIQLIIPDGVTYKVPAVGPLQIREWRELR